MEKYEDQKAAIAAMVAMGDISTDIAQQLMEKLVAELLSATVIYSQLKANNLRTQLILAIAAKYRSHQLHLHQILLHQHLWEDQ